MDEEGQAHVNALQCVIHPSSYDFKCMRRELERRNY